MKNVAAKHVFKLRTVTVRAAVRVAADARAVGESLPPNPARTEARLPDLSFQITPLSQLNAPPVYERTAQHGQETGERRAQHPISFPHFMFLVL